MQSWLQEGCERLCDWSFSTRSARSNRFSTKICSPISLNTMIWMTITGLLPSGLASKRVGISAPLEALYHDSYPDHAFTPQLFKAGCYYGIRHGSTLISVAGVHAFSPAYKVAALGNVTTHPHMRGRGLSRAV